MHVAGGANGFLQTIRQFDDGAVESIGTNDELLKTSPIYQEIYNSQLKKDETM